MKQNGSDYDLQNSQWINISGQDFFLKFNGNPTRSNGFKLYKNRFTTTIRGFSFSQRITNDWNSLPHDIVSALIYISDVYVP